MLLRQVAADTEAVLDSRVQVDLVREAGVFEDLLGLVALLVGEDVVNLRGSDGQGTGDGCELVLADERRVRDKADVDAVLVVADEVLEEGETSACIFTTTALIDDSPLRRSSTRPSQSSWHRTPPSGS